MHRAQPNARQYEEPRESITGTIGHLSLSEDDYQKIQDKLVIQINSSKYQDYFFKGPEPLPQEEQAES